MDAIEIVERIMTEHWDMAACDCWICQAGHKLKLAPRERYLRHRMTYKPPGKSLKEYYNR